MSAYGDQISGLEAHIKQINNPIRAQRAMGWMQRYMQIRAFPDCRRLEDLGVRLTPPVVDLSLLYPHRNKKAA